MARAAPPKSTTYGNKGRGKVVPTKKVPSPTPDDDNENKEDDSIVGKLLDELDDDSPPKSRSTRAKAPPTKPKTAMKSPRKVNPPSLPPSSKVIPKSKLSKEIKPSPPSKATSKGNESESDYDTDEEEEKVKAKSQPKPLKGKKTDNSKLPSSNGSSTKSSLQSKSSSSTREKKALAKKEDTSAPHPLSDDLDDEFGPAFDIAMVDAVDKVSRARVYLRALPSLQRERKLLPLSRPSVTIRMPTKSITLMKGKESKAIRLCLMPELKRKTPKKEMKSCRAMDPIPNPLRIRKVPNRRAETLSPELKSFKL
jgi:hypothetical protein